MTLWTLLTTDGREVGTLKGSESQVKNYCELYHVKHGHFLNYAAKEMTS